MQIFWNNVTKYFLTLLTNHLCGVIVAGFIEAGFADSNQVNHSLALYYCGPPTLEGRYHTVPFMMAAT